ncbi:hypothetical protein [Sphingomonas sp. S2M10]|uniref:hypothetical protein n=1 Tax=Sphingomonas sp. S2M10 TaxID=2705010 RepID=UPI001FFDB31A|nr:hypothetical protein [Sphingomonas sp. S2M10]
MFSEDVSTSSSQDETISPDICILDPLTEDQPDDEIVVTTRRAIGRVAYVAAETAARFQRDAVPYDPMAWMFAPREVFDGAAALDACLHRDACIRGVVLHGIGLGLDVDRASLDILMADDDEGDVPPYTHYYEGRSRGEHRPKPRSTGSNARLRLYTATIVDTRNNVMLQAFHASLAHNVHEVHARLVGRFGPDLADVADIRLGLHPSSPLVISLVPRATAEVIVRMGDDASSPAARTFAVDIQQCIQA